MLLRRHRKHVCGETYEYWSLVKTIRTARGLRHQVVARLGKLDGTQITTARSWEDLDAMLEGRSPDKQLELPCLERRSAPACWQEVDVSRARVERLRQFGWVYLGLALWRVLEQWMRAKGLGDWARQLLLELDELRSMDVVLPVRMEEGAEPTELRLRVVARPEPALVVLLKSLGLELPQRAKFMERLGM